MSSEIDQRWREYLDALVAAIIAGPIDVSDRAARLLGRVYGNTAQLQQLTPADVLANPANLLGVGAFPHLWNVAAARWNRWREGALVGAGLTDPIDRAARLLGIIYGDVGQLAQRAATRDLYVQLRSAGAEIDPRDVTDRAARLLGVIYGSQAQQLQQKVGTFQLLTEDTGLNTNPRRYEVDNGFRSPVVARAGGIATALWTIGTTPARTAGRITVVYTLSIENATAAAITGWLEIAGIAITVPFHIASNDSVVIDFIAGLKTGNNDVNCNASVNGVIFQIVGTEV